MHFFSFVSPILPTETDQFLQYFQKYMKMKQEDPVKENILKDFYTLIGITDWDISTFTFHDKSYALHQIHGDSLREILLRFQYFTLLNVPAATELYHAFMRFFGDDFLLADQLPVVHEKALIAPDISKKDTSYFIQLAVPIEPQKLVLLDETLNHLKDAMTLPKGAFQVEIMHQEHHKGENFIIFNVIGSRPLAWDQVSLGLSASECQNIFNTSKLPFPMTLDKSYAKLGASA